MALRLSARRLSRLVSGRCAGGTGRGFSASGSGRPPPKPPGKGAAGPAATATTAHSHATAVARASGHARRVKRVKGATTVVLLPKVLTEHHVRIGLHAAALVAALLTA